MRVNGKIGPTAHTDNKVTPLGKKQKAKINTGDIQETAPKSSPEKFGKKSEVSDTMTPNEQESLFDQIQSFDPQKLKKVSQHLPKPQGLVKAMEKIKGDSNWDIYNQRFGTEINTQNLDQFKEINSSDISEKIFRPHAKGLDGLIKESFANEEQSLRSKLVNSSRVNNKAENKGRQLVQKLDLNSDLLIKIHTSSDDELRNEIAKSIGGLREDRYGSTATFDSLSSKKQGLVNHIMRGMRAGANQRSLDISMAIQDKAKNVLFKELEGKAPNSDTAFGWSLKSSNDIESEMALKLGWVTQDQLDSVMADAKMDMNPDKLTDWKFQLNQNQVDILESVSKGINTTLNTKLPNRAQQMTQITYSDSGIQKNADVPETFTLNGQTYDSPKYVAKGGLGMILEYTNQNNPDDNVIVKSLLDPLQRTDMVQEMIAHRHLLGGENMTPDDNIITMRGTFKGPSDGIFMVMDKADGDLENLTQILGFAKNNNGISEFSANILTQHYLKEAATGMQKLQSMGSMHNDIKDKNFLFKDGKVLLSDFGSTHTKTTMESSDNVPTTFGGQEWAHGEITQKHDMYAMGVLLHQLNGGSAPPLGEFLKSDPSDVTSLGRLKEGLLSDDPDERLSPQGILDSSYVKNLETVPQPLLNNLLEASENFNKVAGSEYFPLSKEIGNIESNMSVLGNLLQNTPDNVGYQQSYQQMEQDLATKKQEQKALLQDPLVKAAFERLQRASQELDKRTQL